VRTTDLHQRYHGVYLGKVVSVDDPAGLGRVRVETDQVTDSSDDPAWAAVVRPMAGDGPTIFFTPRRNDQVVVAYMQGDPRQPVVLGYAHHKGRAPDGVGTTKHAIHTGAGTITFDEGAHRMVIELGATRVVITPTGIAIEAGTFTINGHRVVLDGFLGTFGAHTHVVLPTPTGGLVATPPGPQIVGPPNTTNG
jgi:phage baseplate assembly protein gpV